MSKTLSRFKKQRKRKFKVPRRVQDLIPVDMIWEDGIFKTGIFYSKCYRFADINFKVASDEHKKEMLNRYAALLGSLDCEAFAQIGTFHHRPTKWDALSSAGVALNGDANDRYRTECNQVISGQSSKRTSYVEDKYITISSHRRNLEDAEDYFKRIDAEIAKAFERLGSACVPMNAEERLLILHNFYRPEESNFFNFNVQKRKQRREDFRSYVAPDGIKRHWNHLMIGKRYARVLFLKDIANYVDDDFIDTMISRNQDILCSVNILPIPKNEGIQDAEQRHMGVLTNNYRYHQRQTANGNFTGALPYQMEHQQIETEKYLRCLTDDDQREMKASFTLVLTANTEKELDRDTEAIRAYAASRNCQMAVMNFEQMAGLNSVLPIGDWQTHVFRTFLSGALAALHPFKVQEILDKHGLYFGENAISHNPILCDKSKLLNPGAIMLGTSGSGKSMSAKFQIANILLGTQEQILIFDPEGEYWPIVKALCGDDATLIRLRAGGSDYLNPLYMVDGYGDGNSISAKSEFIMSLVNRMDDKTLSGHDKSVIDRCLAAIYAEGKRNGTMPTLSTLREKLLEQPEQVAQDVALTLELFTTGSLNIYGRESNVDLSKRVIVFNTHGLGENLKAASLLVITDTILNRTTLNWKQGKRTHIFIDEFHTVFEDDLSTKFFASVWMRFRKRGAFPTAITQNVTYLLNSPEARVMIANSEFIIMLSQSDEDRDLLSTLLKISRDQMSYITNADPGCGLIKYGGTLVPFENRFPKETKLYELMTTRPGEGVFAGGQA